MLEGLLVVTYLVVGALVFKVWKIKNKVVRETVYVPMLDKELAEENKTLQSKLYSAEVRLEKVKQSYEDSLSKNKELQTILDDIYRGQNKYKDIK